MSLRAKQVIVTVLALSAAFVGGWAAIAPQSFFSAFPLPGHHWVAAEPPYNEHLIRDVGGLYLALLAISVWGLVRPRHETFAMIGLAWELFSIPHLIFHSMHLDGLTTFDAVGNVISLGGTAVLAGLLLIPGHRLVRSTEAAA